MVFQTCLNIVNYYFFTYIRGLPLFVGVYHLYFFLGGGNKFKGERLEGGWLWSGFDGGKSCVQIICMAFGSMGDRWYPWVILCGVGGKPSPASLPGQPSPPGVRTLHFPPGRREPLPVCEGRLGCYPLTSWWWVYGLHGDILKWKALGTNSAFKHLGDFMWGRWTPGLHLHPARPAAPGVRTLHFPPRRRGPVPACKGRPG